jgi:squalene-hopene/tetraprenyl-beta-curcumene cyclase
MQGTSVMSTQILDRKAKRMCRVFSCVVVISGLCWSLGCDTNYLSSATVRIEPKSSPVSNFLPQEIEQFQDPIRSEQGASIDMVKTGASVFENRPFQETQTSPADIDRILFQKTSKAGVDFLLEKGQAEDGSFSKQLSPAVTALCVSALIEHRVPLSEARIQKALKFLESQIQPDGGIYPTGSSLRNYETSVSLMCFKRANVGGKYDRTIENAVGFLKGIQWDDGEGHTIDSSFYGGQGYGSHKRPDASNSSYFMDALKAAGEDPKSEAFQKAAIFMSRCQNLSTPHNTAEWASKVTAEDKGGMIYTGVGAGESKAGETPEGGLRSYASMTYAGLKSFLYAGVSKDDIRVKAALDWISRHYDLTSNPGMGQQGLYYYYHVFAKTMSATEQDFIVDSDGISHNWRADLIQQMSKLQRADGSWTNPADRWYEGDPNLVTAYSMLALSYCDQ